MRLISTIPTDIQSALQDREKEKSLPLQEISVDDILDSQRREQEHRHEKHRLISKALKERGLSVNAELTHEEF